MSVIRAALVIGCVIAATAAQAGEGVFGVWNDTPAKCADPSSDSVMTITKAKVSGFEDACNIKHLQAKGDTVDIDTVCLDETGGVSGHEHWKLTIHGNTMAGTHHYQFNGQKQVATFSEVRCR